MQLHQEINDLRKAGKLEEAYTRGKELVNEYPEDQYIKSSFGWVLYEQVKNLVEIAQESQGTQANQSASQLRDILREYYKLNLPRPDLLF
ncbi:hypothetical protein [Brunnivagina elsteri]|uniref:Tetratricopeptide repeat protein n=1 Tax=Brunnivagina elsteri CCALA 953 TaxID=987040 RepID=A0A2A2TIV5_9CYAN|nr:hypothetical protein [Calothrix elsteri]PAX54139.1 hypothetical protein CK510_12690 [Calothrix elsteri CCALA 953]